MTAQRNPPVDTRSSPSHDSANGPVGVRNESARKRGSLHYHQPLLSMMMKSTHQRSSLFRRRRSRLTLSQCKNLEKTHLLQKAQAWLVWNYEIGYSGKSIQLIEAIAVTSICSGIGILIGINYSYGFVLGGVIKKEESTVASEFHSRLDHVRKQIPVSHESKPKVRRKYKFWELESIDILDSVEDNPTSSKLKQAFKEAVQFDGERYTVDLL
ncbi:hypothetical protein T08_8221 [Trichinella sp. T8]|nr:hypothetical protein T08_8221 [Trichinella sp. T8]